VAASWFARWRQLIDRWRQVFLDRGRGARACQVGGRLTAVGVSSWGGFLSRFGLASAGRTRRWFGTSGRGGGAGPRWRWQWFWGPSQMSVVRSG
jgi:hypothetical protein